jgi:succinate dehydrogenase / fumarate reductase cytochrome b subunit
VSTAVAPNNTTDHTADQTAPYLFRGTNYFLFRRLHSLTGLVFGGYLIVHLLVNATIAQGGIHYQQQVDKIHSLPFLGVIEWTAIYLPILYHTAYGIWIWLTGQANADRYPYTKNIFYILQRWSAAFIVFFMVFHVMSLKYGWAGTSMRFDPHHALGTVARHFDHWLIWPLYVVGILASCYHLANGFWTAAITWGLTISAESQRRFGYICAGLFVLLTIAGFVALFAGIALDAQDLLKVQQVVGHGA